MLGAGRVRAKKRHQHPAISLFESEHEMEKENGKMKPAEGDQRGTRASYGVLLAWGRMAFR